MNDQFENKAVPATGKRSGVGKVGVWEYVRRGACAIVSFICAGMKCMPKVEDPIDKTILANSFVSGPYERLFLEPGQEGQFIRNYIDFYAGTVEYFFRLEEYYNLLVVGLQSPLGFISLVVVSKEDLVKLPDYIQNTKMMYVVDSIYSAYAKAEKNGIPILQARTPNIMGAQGRLELAPGYIIEVVEATNKSLFDPDIDSLGLPPAKVLV